MKKTINFCGNCPFVYSDYDDFAVGDSTVDICTLARFLNLENDIISVHNEMGYNDNSDTPEWCPLKKEDYSFSFKEFSEERQKEIDSATSELKELMKIEEQLEDDDVELYDKMLKLNKKLIVLCENEEKEESLEELNEEIQKQLDTLAKETIKLSDTFKNLGNENL